MPKGANTEVQETQPPEERVALEVWLDEVGLDPARASLMRVLYRGEKRTRGEWQALLEEVLARPAK